MSKSHDHLIWHTERGVYELDEQGSGNHLPLTSDEDRWVAWLESISSFSFSGQHGRLTVRKEARPRGDQYWYAYRRVGPKMAKKYLSRTVDLTLARLEEVAAAFPPALAAQLPLPRDPLLATKLHPPHPRSRLIARPHLLAHLQHGMEHALTLISAPAGFGKTTLLSQWLTESGTPVAWLSLDPEDNDPVRFLNYVLAALQTLMPPLSMTVLRLLETAQATPLESVFTVLTNDLTDQEMPDFALVLDDYHVITTPAIHQALAFLVSHLPPHMHLILASRADPPLPLASLRASGRLIELRANELRLDVTEMRTFLWLMLGFDLPTEALEMLARRTEGWVAGLQLAALSLREGADIPAFVAAFTGSHRFVLDYLSEEVLSRQPEQVQSFLLHISLFERLCGSLCEAVTGQEGGQAMLEALERANLFLVPLDEERQWYRYHHLFAEVLKNRLEQTEPELVPELHRRASAWYQHHGFLTEAVQHALLAHDVELAAELMSQTSFFASLVAQGRTQILFEWFKALPDTLVRAHPLLCIYHAGALHVNNQVEEAEARLQDAERVLPAALSAEETGIALSVTANIRANMARYRGDLARYLTLGQQALDLIPETAPMSLRAIPTMQLAEVRRFVPQMRAAVAAARAQVELMQGHVDAATRWAQASGLSAADEELSYSQEQAYLTLARVRIAQAREQAAAPLLQDVLSLLDRMLADAEAKARRGSVLAILIVQALALHALHDRTGALTTLERALVLAAPEGYIRLFVDEGAPMRELLRQARSRRIIPSYVATLLAAFAEPGEGAAVSSPSHPNLLIEPLTRREREVLHLLAEGASNREIARRLVLSLGTVKKYVYTICSKLGVQSRTQALVRAQTLHLL